MLVMRHAESLEDVDNAVYELVPDYAIGLTENGRSQATGAATEIVSRIGTSRYLSIFYSPARRAEETADAVAACIRSATNGAVSVSRKSDGRLVKQDWGSVTVATRAEHLRRRYEAGAMNYKFPNGESGWDVATRMRSFIGEVTTSLAPSDDIVVVTHGFEFRIALMILLGWTESQFEQYANPPNCFIADVRTHDNVRTLVSKHPPLYTPGPSHISRVL